MTVFSPATRARFRRPPFIPQETANECALACLAMVLRFFGSNNGLNELRSSSPVAGQPLTLAKLASLAERHGLESRALSLRLAELTELRRPAILHWELTHFVVLEQVNRRRVTILDPAIGRRHLALHEVGESFTGVALELQPRVAFKPAPAPPKLTFMALLRATSGLLRPLATLLALSLVLQVLALLAPLYMQLTLDQVVATGDHDLARVLLLAFCVLIVTKIATVAIRGLLAVRVSAELQLAWRGGFFRRLLALPLSYFQERSTADVQSRMQSLATLETTLSQHAVAGVLDGLFGATTLALLWLYSPLVASVALVGGALAVVWRFAFLRASRERHQQCLLSVAAREAVLLQGLRTIVSVKTTIAEPHYLERYRNRQVDVNNAQLRLAQLEISVGAGFELLLQLTRACVIFLASIAVIRNELSVGALVALVAWLVQFLDRLQTLADRLIAFRLARVDLGRADDVFATLAEPSAQVPRYSVRPIRLDVHELGLRQGPSGAWLFRDLTLRVAAGEHVVVTGPSGSGKSTLLKVLAGLLPRQEGSVVVDGQQLSAAGLVGHRHAIGCVLQDDAIAGGCIAEAISAFATPVATADVKRAAELAGIAATIEQMPLAYQSRIGDLGGALSSGQRQRLLLARALYRRPRLLLLDEATSHLDPAAESEIFANLRRLNVSILAVAHRNEAIASADRVVEWSSLVRPLRAR